MNKLLIGIFAAATMFAVAPAKAAPFCPPFLPFCHLPPPPPPPHVVHTTPTLPQNGHNMSPLANMLVWGGIGGTGLMMAHNGYIGATQHREATAREMHADAMNIFLPFIGGWLVESHYKKMCAAGNSFYC